MISFFLSARTASANVELLSRRVHNVVPLECRHVLEHVEKTLLNGSRTFETTAGQ